MKNRWHLNCFSIKSLVSEIPYGSLLSRKFLFIILYDMHCFMLPLNKESDFFITTCHTGILSRWDRTRVYLSTWLLPCSLCYFGKPLKSLHFFWLLSEIKKSDKTAEILVFFLSLSFCKSIYLLCSVTPSKSAEVSSLSVFESEIALLCRQAGNRNQTVIFLKLPQTFSKSFRVKPLTNVAVEDLHIK